MEIAYDMHARTCVRTGTGTICTQFYRDVTVYLEAWYQYIRYGMHSHFTRAAPESGPVRRAILFLLRASPGDCTHSHPSSFHHHPATLQPCVSSVCCSSLRSSACSEPFKSLRVLMPQVRGLNFRRKGTASRRTYTRYNPEDSEWPEANENENNAAVEELKEPVEKETVGKDIEVEKQEATRPKSSFRSRRRKKPRNDDVASNDSGLEKKVAAQCEKGQPAQDKETSQVLARSMSEEECVVQDTPMHVPKRPCTSASLISPDEEGITTQPSTPASNSVSKPRVGEKVLDLIYSPVGTSPFTNNEPSGNGWAKKLSPERLRKRKLQLEPAPKENEALAQDVEWMDALATGATESPNRHDGCSLRSRSSVLEANKQDHAAATSVMKKRHLDSKALGDTDSVKKRTGIETERRDRSENAAASGARKSLIQALQPPKKSTKNSHHSAAPSPDLRLRLSDVIKNASIATKQDFLFRSPHTPVPVIDISVSGEMRTSRGQIGCGQENLSWWQASRDAKDQFYLNYVITDVVGGGDIWSSDGGQHIQWEAHILDWIRTCCGNQQQLENFPKPLQLGTSAKDSCMLRLGFTCQGESAFHYEVLGTLEDIVHWHCKHNVGPIPEAVVAWLVLQIVRCVRTLHECHVTHNHLGLDSFLLVQRKHASVENDSQGEWLVVCTELGAGARVESLNEASLNNGNTSSWPFKHDLFSVANIAYLLLSGGIPLSWRRKSDGSIDLPWKCHVFSNIYLRGEIAWEDFFQALVNPKTSSCGMHLVDFPCARELDAATQPRGSEANNSTSWPEMTDACNLLNTVSEMGRKLGYFQRLAEHVKHDSVVGPLLARLRFPVKLVEGPFDVGEGLSKLGDDKTIVSTGQKDEESSIVISKRQQEASLKDDEILKLKTLLSNKEEELHSVRGKCLEKLEAANSKHQREIAQQQEQSAAKLKDAKDSEQRLRQLLEALQNGGSLGHQEREKENMYLRQLLANSNKQLNESIMQLDAIKADRMRMQLFYESALQQERDGANVKQRDLFGALQRSKITTDSQLSTKDEQLKRLQADLAHESKLRQKLERRLAQHSENTHSANESEREEAAKKHRLQLQKAKEEIKTLQARYAESTERLDVTEKKVDALEAGKKQVEQSHHADCERLQKEKDECVKDAAEREQQMRTTQEENERSFTILLAEKEHELELVQNDFASHRERTGVQLNSAKALITILKSRLKSAERVNGALEQKYDKLAKGLQGDHDESLRILKEKHSAESEVQRVRLLQLESELSARAEENCRKDRKIEELHVQVASLKAEIKKQSGLHEDTKLHLEGEVSRLTKKVTSSDAKLRELESHVREREKQMAQRQKNLEGTQRWLEERRISVERDAFEKDEQLRKSSNDLAKQRKAFEEEVRRRQREWAQEKHQQAQGQPRLPASSRRSQRDARNKGSPLSSASSGSFRGGKKSMRLRNQEAAHIIIPGQSLSLAAVAGLAAPSKIRIDELSSSESDSGSEV